MIAFGQLQTLHYSKEDWARRLVPLPVSFGEKRDRIGFVGCLTFDAEMVRKMYADYITGRAGSALQLHTWAQHSAFGKPLVRSASVLWIRAVNNLVICWFLSSGKVTVTVAKVLHISYSGSYCPYEASISASGHSLRDCHFVQLEGRKDLSSEGLFWPLT